MEKVYKEFDERLIVTKEVFYSDNSSFGVYGFKFEDEVNKEVKLHPIYKNFTIVGTVPQLVEGKSYMVHFTEAYDEKKGVDIYKFIKVKSDGVKGKEANHAFIRAMLTDIQADNIILNFYDREELVKDILTDKVNLTQVEGIGEIVAEKIKLKLSDVDDYSTAIIELAPLGVGINSIKKLVDHFGDVQKLLEVLNKNIYRLTEVDGFGFKKIDKLALELGISKNDPRRIKAGSIYVIQELVNLSGSTKIDVELFDKKMCDILEVEEVDSELFTKIMKDERIYYDKGFISLKTYREEEYQIVQKLRSIRDNFNSEYSEEVITNAITMNELKNGFKFTDEQKEAIHKGIQNGVLVLDGVAGAGKSKLVKVIIDVISKHLAVSLSGKAVNVLSLNEMTAATIHRALSRHITIDPKSEESYLDYDIIIVDEASMIDNSIFNWLLSYITDGTQLVIVGDSGQLPAIGRGAVFDYLLSSTEFARATLTKVHRQALDSGTLTVANEVRKGNQFRSSSETGLKVFGNNKDFYYFSYNDKTLILNDIILTVKKYISNPEKNLDDIQVITGLKSKGELSVMNLNKLLQPIFNPPKVSDDELTNSNYTFRVGDRVIQQGNNYKARIMTKTQFADYTNGFVKMNAIQFESTEVFNGTFGKIIGCAEGYGMLIDFEGIDGLVFYQKDEDDDEIGVLDLGYAITCHRSQGSGFKTLIIAVTYNDYMLLSRQFLYTALTRTIDQCFLFGESKAVQYAIKTDKGKNRKCFIGEFLK